MTRRPRFIRREIIFSPSIPPTFTPCATAFPLPLPFFAPSSIFLSSLSHFSIFFPLVSPSLPCRFGVGNRFTGSSFHSLGFTRGSRTRGRLNCTINCNPTCARYATVSSAMDRPWPRYRYHWSTLFVIARPCNCSLRGRGIGGLVRRIR